MPCFGQSFLQKYAVTETADEFRIIRFFFGKKSVCFFRLLIVGHLEKEISETKIGRNKEIDIAIN